MARLDDFALTRRKLEATGADIFIEDEQTARLERTRHFAKEVFQLLDMVNRTRAPDRIILGHGQPHLIQIRDLIVDVCISRSLRCGLRGGDRLIGDVQRITIDKDTELCHAPFQASLTTAQAETPRQR